MKVSFITTVYNEKNTIGSLLDSLAKQTQLPDEIIIVDGGSTDETTTVISNFQTQNSNINVKLIIKKGNRSVGRNEAISHVTGSIIAISDAGCILDKNWLKNIVKPFNDTAVDVVAGFYKGQAKTAFEKALIPYVLVMPDKVDPEKFLPATRSMAIRKSVWTEMGGFDEKLSHNEDYAFAKKLKSKNKKITFCKDAIVSWKPRNRIKESFWMFYRFAYGDAESGLLRPKVVLIFLRYLLFLLLLGVSFLIQQVNIIVLLMLPLFISYGIWAVHKNYRYIKDSHSILWLPVLQVISDIAVLSGTLFGLVNRIFCLKDYKNTFRSNKMLWFALGIYVLVMLSMIGWGIPNVQHPFNYHMDEWHQLMAVRGLFTQGTPNIEGAAHGTILHFLISGIFLAPIALLVQSESAIKESLAIQQFIFVLLRLNTIFFGVLSLVVLHLILKEHFKMKFPGIFLFLLTPIWLMLSNYFKYDIGLMFWIILATHLMLRLKSHMLMRDYLFAGIGIGLAISTKVSALPLLLGYFLIALLFHSRNYKKILIGFFFIIITVGIFGMPDILFGNATYGDFFSSNLKDVPAESSNFILGMHYWFYLFVNQYPLLFGYAFYFLYILGSFYVLYTIISTLLKQRSIENVKKQIALLILFFLFLSSLYPLKLYATGNRSLVLLPFFAVFASLLLEKIFNSVKQKGRKVITVVLILLFLLQLYENIAFIALKYSKDPRVLASEWIVENIPAQATIGIENIPIYQKLPDVLLMEHYMPERSSRDYNLEIVDAQTKNIPHIVVITDYDIALNYQKQSAKKQLLQELSQQGYQPVRVFHPNSVLLQRFHNWLSLHISGIVPTPSIAIYKKI